MKNKTQKLEKTFRDFMDEMVAYRNKAETMGDFNVSCKAEREMENSFREMKKNLVYR